MIVLKKITSHSPSTSNYTYHKLTLQCKTTAVNVYSQLKETTSGHHCRKIRVEFFCQKSKGSRKIEGMVEEVRKRCGKGREAKDMQKQKRPSNCTRQILILPSNELSKKKINDYFLLKFAIDRYTSVYLQNLPSFLHT